MKNLLFILTIMLSLTVAGFAQTSNPSNNSSSNSNDYNETEFYLGYTFSKAKVKEYDRDLRLIQNAALSQTFRKRATFEKGFAAAGVYNLTRGLGVKADFSRSYNGRVGQIANQKFEITEHLTTLAFGVQAKDNNKDTSNRFRPFANVLAGLAKTKSKADTCTPFGTTCPDSLNKSKTGWVGIAGVGLDIKINQRVSYRVLQADYMVGKVTQGWRFSSGVVF